MFSYVLTQPDVAVAGSYELAYTMLWCLRTKTITVRNLTPHRKINKTSYYPLFMLCFTKAAY